MKLHISIQLQIVLNVSASRCSTFPSLSLQYRRPLCLWFKTESFYLALTFIIHCVLSVDCYFRLELEIINLREALVILHFMKHSCLSTAVQWWQNAPCCCSVSQYLCAFKSLFCLFVCRLTLWQACLCFAWEELLLSHLSFIQLF